MKSKSPEAEPVPETDSEHFGCPDGMLVRTTSRGITVVELDFRADPVYRDDKDFQERMTRLIGSSRFSREYLRNWAVSGGDRYYAEFTAERNVQRLDKLIDAPIIRGFDFGRRNPACVWLQYSPKSRRAWVIRELLCYDMNVYNLRDLVLYLSGERPYQFLVDNSRIQALNHLERMQKMKQWDDSPLPPAPWFEPGQTFWNYAGHEAMMTSGLVEKQGEAVTWKDVMADGGIQLGAYFTRESAKETVMRKLLHTLPDGMPGLMMDPCCKLLIEGFIGGISYAKPSAANPRPDHRANDGKYEHLDDALGYGLVNIVPVDDGGKSEKNEQDRLGVAMRGHDFRPSEVHIADNGEGFESGYLEDRWE